MVCSLFLLKGSVSLLGLLVPARCLEGISIAVKTIEIKLNELDFNYQMVENSWRWKFKPQGHNVFYVSIFVCMSGNQRVNFLCLQMSFLTYSESIFNHISKLSLGENLVFLLISTWSIIEHIIIRIVMWDWQPKLSFADLILKYSLSSQRLITGIT